MRADRTVAEGTEPPARHVARFHEIATELGARIDWPEQQLREERRRALRALVTTAVERSPWHRSRLSNLDVDALTEADLAPLPTMTKSDLMDNFDAIVTDPRVTLEMCESVLDGRNAGNYLFDEYRVVASRGSSGRRGVFVYGWDAWATCYASIVRFQQRDWSSDPQLAGVPRGDGRAWRGGRVALQNPISSSVSPPFPRSRSRLISLVGNISSSMNRVRAGITYSG